MFTRFATNVIRQRHLLRGLLLVAGMLVVTHVAARETPVNPEDSDYLRRQYVWFQAQSTQRQQQLRQLNQDFTALDAAEQAKYTRTLQRYNVWLNKLPDSDRRRVLEATNGPQRLAVVNDLRMRDWIETLPKSQRDEYAALDEKARSQWVKDRRAEEVERNEEWALAQKHWQDIQSGRPPIVDKKPDFDLFVNNLRTHLTDGERKQLDDIKQTAEENGMHVWYIIEIVRLADLHPLLPGRPGPRSYETLPDDVKQMLRGELRPVKKKLLPGEELKEFKRANGRWPDYAIEVTKMCAASNGRFVLSKPLGDCRKEDMPEEVREFMNRKLEPLLNRTPAGKMQLEALKKLEGTWPDYPKMIVELAKQNNEPIPGWTLPGPRTNWDRFRPKGKLK